MGFITPLAAALISTGVGAVGAIAQYSAQNAEAKQNQKNAITAWTNDQNQLTKRSMQEEDALRQKQTQSNIEEAQAKADTETSAASSGVSGITLDTLIADVGRRAATNRQVEEDNTLATLDQIRQQRTGTNATAQSRINSVSKASPLSLVAGIGGAAISGYNSYSKYKNP